ncbi:DNA replication complex GINS protein PSF1-like isoform X1 [Uloborus diversus]|uniref:DNA replication complex GINS protein PSF1-like isoform X1 n=1 Tax=Uloborus diversus TaxID=327109 RepID=UPI00240A0F5D|nr:DNA replication complex GINS protein PSF1-like isoform X1 [Uloborus diversus]
MLGDKALELIKQLQRCDYLNPLQDEVLRQVFEEMKALFEENQVDVNASISGEMQYHAAVQLRHSVLLRNKRCVLTYLYNRLQMIRDIRWGFGAVLPADVRSCLSEAEVNWFNTYNRSVASYMTSIGGVGVDLFLNLQPPKSLYIQVRCLCDYGDFETSDGNTVVLSKNSTHFLQRADCEKLIHQGILEHISV